MGAYPLHQCGKTSHFCLFATLHRHYNTVVTDNPVSFAAHWRMVGSAGLPTHIEQLRARQDSRTEASAHRRRRRPRPARANLSPMLRSGTFFSRTLAPRANLSSMLRSGTFFSRTLARSRQPLLDASERDVLFAHASASRQPLPDASERDFLYMPTAYHIFENPYIGQNPMLSMSRTCYSPLSIAMGRGWGWGWFNPDSRVCAWSDR